MSDTDGVQSGSPSARHLLLQGFFQDDGHDDWRHPWYGSVFHHTTVQSLYKCRHIFLTQANVSNKDPNILSLISSMKSRMREVSRHSPDQYSILSM